MDWVLGHLGDIGNLTAAHIGLCVPAIVIGFVVSVPLGYLASRSAVARGLLLTLGNVLYTIPGIALVVLVPVVLGLQILNPLNVTVALLVYAVAIMVRSAADAFSSVSADVRQAATGQGYSAAQRFWRVELPLAGPVLLAGVRVVSVSTISLATVGALIGIPSLGSFFPDAFQRNFVLELPPVQSNCEQRHSFHIVGGHIHYNLNSVVAYRCSFSAPVMVDDHSDRGGLLAALDKLVGTLLEDGCVKSQIAIWHTR